MAWAPDYCAPDELADYVDIDEIGEEVDAPELALAVTAASRAIDGFTRRQFGKVAGLEARRYRPWRGTGSPADYVVDIDDLSTAAGVLVDGVAVDPLLLSPENAPAVARPYTRLYVAACETVTVTGVWGWAAVPAAVKQACLLQANRFLVRRHSPYGVAGSPSEGSEVRLLARLDPDVAVALRTYHRRAVPR